MHHWHAREIPYGSPPRQTSLLFSILAGHRSPAPSTICISTATPGWANPTASEPVNSEAPGPRPSKMVRGPIHNESKH